MKTKISGNDPYDVEYPIVILADRYPDGGLCYVVEYPDLPGCVAHHSDLDQARQLLSQARITYIKYLISFKKEVPLPNPERPPEVFVGVGGTVDALQEARWEGENQVV